MSLPRTETVPCPKCGKEIEFTLWQSINNEIPTAMADVISGKLFETECRHCGHKINVNYPILVNDMEHNAMVYYVHPDNIEEAEKAVRDMSRLYMGRTRIVTDQAALREKIAIFNADLDDRVIELIKALVMLNVKDQLAGKDVKGVYYIADDNPRLEIIMDDGPGYIPVGMDLYNAVKDQFSENPAFNEDNIYIDPSWAYSLITC